MPAEAGPTSRRILYCRCAYAQVVPREVKDAVLESLCAAGARFDAVADLCEMSARRDPALKTLAAGGDLTIAACYPRAVRGLFQAADATLPAEGVDILNMRTAPAEQIVRVLIHGEPMHDDEAVAAGAPEPVAAVSGDGRVGP